MCCRKTLAQFNQSNAKVQYLISNSFPTHTVLSNQTPQALEIVVTQCPKQLCTCLSNAFASWTCSAASLRTACASPCRKPQTQVSFPYHPLNLKFQVTSLYRLHLTLSVIKGLVKWIITPYHVSLAHVMTLIHVFVDLIPHKFSPTCSWAPQGSFSSFCTTAHLLLGNRRISTEPVQQTITAYETGQVIFQKLHLTCRAGVVLATTTQITNSTKMQLRIFLLENPDNLSFQCNIWCKGVKFACPILSQRGMA